MDVSQAKVTVADLRGYAREGRKIVMVTASDAITGGLASDAGVDVVLVGDHAASVLLGCSSTVEVTLEEMIVLTRAVSRGASRPLVVVDLPFASFEISDEQAVGTALRLVKEGRADAIKLEPGRVALSRARAIRAAGIEVMAHVGLSSEDVMGGIFTPLGTTEESARKLVEEVRALEEAGVFAVLLEALPGELATLVTHAVGVPTIGVGSGVGCSGQILSGHDVVGLDPSHSPPWVKRYGTLYEDALDGLRRYADDVREGRFPASEHTFALAPEAADSIRSLLEA